MVTLAFKLVQVKRSKENPFYVSLADFYKRGQPKANLLFPIDGTKSCSFLRFCYLNLQATLQQMNQAKKLVLNDFCKRNVDRYALLCF